MKTEKKEDSRAKDGKKAGQEEKKSFSFGKLFYNNKFVAVFSVLCALAIWFSMAFTNTEEFPVPIRNVPVTIKIPEAAQAEGLRCFSPQTLSVTVYIKGNSLSVRNVTADNIGLETQITETISGAKTYLATISSSKKGYVTDYEIDRIEPSIVQLTLDYSEEKTFTIDTSGVNSSAADGYFVGSVAAAPETITVSGPKSVVDSISAVTVGDKELGELSETARQTSDLILLDANGNTISRDKYDQLSLSTETAEITVPVYVRKTVPFTANFTNAPSGIDLDSSFVTLSPSTVELAGTEEDFASYRSIQLNPIDFSQISPDTSVFDIPVTLPAFFRNLQEIDEVTVSLKNLNDGSAYRYAVIPWDASVEEVEASLGEALDKIPQVTKQETDTYKLPETRTLEEIKEQVEIQFQFRQNMLKKVAFVYRGEVGKVSERKEEVYQKTLEAVTALYGEPQEVQDYTVKADREYGYANWPPQGQTTLSVVNQATVSIIIGIQE